MVWSLKSSIKLTITEGRFEVGQLINGKKHLQSY